MVRKLQGVVAARPQTRPASRGYCNEMTGNTDLRERRAAIVVVGNFNPLIFQPRWLSEQGIIGVQEAEAAQKEAEALSEQNEVELIHKQLVILNFQRLRLQVTLDRFSIEATEPPLVVAKDFAQKCFGLLSHTPTQQVGINFITVFRARSRADWDALGDVLVPKTPWKLLLGDGERTGGMRSLNVERNQRADGLDGKKVVSVEIVEPTANLETQISINDHYELGLARAPAVSEILANHWDESEKAALEMTDHLRSLCRAN